MTRKVSAVIPVFNSAEYVAPLLARVTTALTSLCNEHEIVLVNDGSKDNSWELIQKAMSKDHRVIGINLTRNFGQHNALLCGIRRARYPVIVTLDDDLQNPPEEIGKLLITLDEGYDVVYGVPIKQEHDTIRVLGSVLIKWALSASMGVNVARDVQPFRAFRTSLRNGFEHHAAANVFIDALLSWSTTNFGRVLVEHVPRALGPSNYSFGKLLTHALKMVTGYSVAPLRVASLLGLCLTVFGSILFAVVLVGYFLDGGTPPGFAFLACAIAIFSGGQLFFLGIFGEYLGQIYSRTMDRPPYVVREEDGAE